MRLKNSFRVLGVSFVAISIFIFYILGGHYFPDYENYILLASNDGWLFSENEYMFEWLSRGILRLAIRTGLSAEYAVIVLTIINQIICTWFFIYLITHKNRKINFGGVLLFSLIGFLLITTTLRASPAYLALTLLALREFRFNLTNTLIMLFGLAWHDTFIIPIIIITASIITTKITSINYYLKAINFDKLIVYISIAILFFTEQLRDLLLSIFGVEAGIRAIYFEGDGAHSIAKLIYCAMALLICKLSQIDNDLSERLQRFAALLGFSIAITYLISGTAAVRLSMYAFCTFIPLRGIYFFDYENKKYIRLIQFTTLPLLFGFNIFETLRQTT